MARRDHESADGYVSFPTHLPCSGEGGVFVRLVAVPLPHDDRPYGDWMHCCGGFHEVRRDGAFLGSDTGKPEEFFYPSQVDHDGIHLLASVTLGSTGWAPVEGWVCQPADLTPDGVRLYNLLAHLYGGKARLHLQTWLDT